MLAALNVSLTVNSVRCNLIRGAHVKTHLKQMKDNKQRRTKKPFRHDCGFPSFILSALQVRSYASERRRRKCIIYFFSTSNIIMYRVIKRKKKHERNKVFLQCAHYYLFLSYLRFLLRKVLFEKVCFSLLPSSY